MLTSLADKLFGSRQPSIEIGGASSLTLSPQKHDVFLSFRGEDTRDNIVSHLRAALRREKIDVYIDDLLERGDEISPALKSAIKGSRLAVVVFSANYAASSWCLDELVHILQCRETRRMFVVPVFFRVDPSDVRKQRGNYGYSFNTLSRHHNKTRVSKWRCGLTAAANISGWDSANIRSEAELVDIIVEDIIGKLRGVSPTVDFTGLIGIPERLKVVESMFKIGSPEVRIIGLWGMGGIGKTALAKIVYNRLSFQFEACCFLTNVRDEWEGGRKECHLQNKLMSELFKDENVKVDNIYRLFDKNRLMRKKVLIVLDAVDDARQLDIIVGGRDWYGPGSRIMMTSRDRQALDGSDEIYEVTELSRDEALHLFQSKAFKEVPLTGDQIKWSTRVVHDYADCNPLALESIAYILRGKSTDKWDAILQNIREFSDDGIQKRLEVSYIRLCDQKKNVFLDIACFFNRENKDFVERILNGCGFNASDGIEDLILKSLLTIMDSKKLWMQHLIEAMGRAIVRAESVIEPGVRSRLWNPEDICHVFRNRSETSAVQGIFLDMCKIEMVVVSSAMFSKMFNLRVLKFHNHFGKCTLQFPPDCPALQLLPEQLRYLYWDDYPFPSLPSGFTGANLVELKMQFSKVKRLWDKVQRLDNLKVIDLSFSKQLLEIPNLSRAPNVETVCLRGCKLVREVPTYFQDLEKLISLNLEGCSSLERVSALPRNIAEVNLMHCESLSSLPRNIPELDSLSCLQLAGCSSFEYMNYPEIISIHSK